jgi:predicted NBD/HSP70 family sugar kinase
VDDVIGCATAGDPTAADALAEVGWHVGRGLAMIVSAFAPGRIYLGGEIAAAWPLGAVALVVAPAFAAPRVA